VGWCALDPKRRPLTGAEQRGCWQERPTAAEAAHLLAEPRPGQGPSGEPGQDDPERREPVHRDFIPVELLGPIAPPSSPAREAAGDAGVALPPAAPMFADLDESWAERTSLFGELEA